MTSSAAMSCTSGVCAGSSAALTAQRASSASVCAEETNIASMLRSTSSLMRRRSPCGSPRDGLMISARSRLDAAASLVGEFGEVWVREVGHDDAERVRGAGLEGSGDGVGVVIEPLRRVEHPLRGVR